MNPYWYKNSIIYAVDIKSYQDSNSDGIGDIRGLISRLGYISDLGVDCLWLLPFYPSPWRDNGYDITDYMGVDPRLGTFDDFLELVYRAGELGIKIIIDFVLNHTSDQHPWFQAARRDSKSKYFDYYVWSAHPPETAQQGVAFPGEEMSTWSYDKLAHKYYFHRFYHFQPDLRISNPDVRDEIIKVMDFWLSFGIAGFRLDALPIMIHPKGGLEGSRLTDPHGFLRGLRCFLDSRTSGAVLLGEVDVYGKELLDYFADRDELHMSMNFLLNAHLILALASMKAEPLVRGWRELPVLPDMGQWVFFLRNLDELNIGQLSSHEQKLIYDLLATEDEHHIYGRGIRRRIAALFKGNVHRLRMSYSLLFSLPGVPLIVYGDELGMGDQLALKAREAVRTPMQWDNSLGAGFSTLHPDQFYRPLVSEDRFSPMSINVEDQIRDQGSLLNWFKRLVRMRKQHSEIGWGHIEWITTDCPEVVAHITHWQNDILLAVHNLSDRSCDVVLNLSTVYAKDLILIFGAEVSLEVLDSIGYRLHMGDYAFAWFNVRR